MLLTFLYLNAGMSASTPKTFETLMDEVRTGFKREGSALSPRVEAAMRKVNRLDFMLPGTPPELAFVNTPFSIGHGQTISQPFIVAYMTQLLNIQPGDKVLEIGTGSGYQTAVLAQLADKVYTIEVVKAFADQTWPKLELYQNVIKEIGDGSRGWVRYAPFNKIILTAAPETVPPALIEQLAPGGRMVIPVGAQGGNQVLKVIDKDQLGRITEKVVMGVRFVPVTHGEVQ